ncbi:DUF4184 family protein [Frigoribacterium sp. 2-23]|uniref:DUF4184 family protein n=1 Tax=Frigoribacterium sp. 2-23 TaxID=3415006 RepID=UPI003C6F1862
MPFTISHAVVALPFRRTALPVAAVAVGAMAPDVVLFVPALASYASTHSWWGILTLDLLFALVLLLGWWLLLRPAWSAVVPGVRDRVPSAWQERERVGVRRLPVVVLACVLGSATHVGWDAFTHPHGVAVLALAPLRQQVLGVPVYSALQMLSSVAGLAVLCGAGLLWWRRARPLRDSPVSVLDRAVLVLAVVAVLGGTAAVAIRAFVVSGGQVSSVVIALAFRLPAIAVVVSVLGAVVLLIGRRRTRARGGRVGRSASRTG